MGRYQSPLVKHDLSRLADAEGRHIALTSLKNCVKQLDPECLPFFLDQIGEAHQDVSRPYVISLYEDVARTHQTLLVPFLPRIMEALITALSESGSSLHVHQACAKVVAALAKFCIDLERLTQQAKDVLRLICEPLLCVLVGKFEPVAAGAAVNLQALVECGNWIHAPRELVNEVCFRVTAAVSGKSTPTVAHLQLACSVARVNREVFESYGLELMNAAKDILQVASSWTLRVAAAQLLNLVLGMVDGIVLATEIASVIDVLEKFRLDRMPKVRSAVAEALRTARSCYYSGGGATTKMIFSVGVENKKRQDFQDAGIRAIVLPSFQNEFGKRDAGMRRPKFDRRGAGPYDDDGGCDFVIVEDYGPHYQPHRKRNTTGSRRSGKNRSEKVMSDGPRVRHTVSAEPGGYVIQEWIKVDENDRFGVLAGIEEGDEYGEQPAYVRESMFGQQFYTPALSPSERHVVIFDEDQVATDTCKRLIENSQTASTSAVPPPSDPVPSCTTLEEGSPSPRSSSNLMQDSKAEEWSVRDNPIARKDGEGRSPYERSITPPQARPDAILAPEVPSSTNNTEDPLPVCSAEEQTIQKEESRTVTVDKIDAGSWDPSEPKQEKSDEQQPVGEIKSSSEKMVHAFRRSWEGLTTETKHEDLESTATMTTETTTETTTIRSSRKQQLVKALTSSLSLSFTKKREEQRSWHRFYKFQTGVESLLGGSVCAVLAIPAAMALIKCVEPNFSCRDMVPT